MKKLSPNTRFIALYEYTSCSNGYRFKSATISVKDSFIRPIMPSQSRQDAETMIFYSDTNVVRHMRWETDNKLIIITDDDKGHVLEQKTHIMMGAYPIEIEYRGAASEPPR